MIKKVILSAATVLMLTPSTIAQQSPTENPCESEAQFRQFDFWLGDWNVYLSDGTLSGVQQVLKARSACHIEATWLSAQLTTGFSMGYYDVDGERWRQMWVGDGTQIDYSGRVDEAGAMRLEGTVTSITSGGSAPFRGVFSPNEDGSVTQEFHVRPTGSDEWREWFVGYSVRPAEEPHNEAAQMLWVEFESHFSR